MDLGFEKFVAIKLANAEETSVEYKSIKSYVDATKGSAAMTVDNSLRLWVVDMIDRGLTATTRKRYIAKLGALYKEYCGESLTLPDTLPYADIASRKEIEAQAEHLSRIFDTLIADAKARPSLAVFIYLLFSASADIERAAALTIDDTDLAIALLTDIIGIEDLHHRRKYIFSLGQGRRRMPQIIREVVRYIDHYLMQRGLRFKHGFTPDMIPALWIARARQRGEALTDISRAVVSLPDAYSYLRLMPDREISRQQVDEIKDRVARSFAPIANRWYAMKLRRGVSYDDMRSALDSLLPHITAKTEFFYPLRETARREGKRLIKETQPVIPDIVFFKIQSRHVRSIDAAIKTENLGWVYRTVNSSESEYSVIDNTSMLIFERTVGRFSSDIKMALAGSQQLGVGRRVRITGGVMAGYTGMIQDIKDDTAGGRIFFIKLSSTDCLKIQVNVEEMYIEPINQAI